MADAADSKSAWGNSVRVRIPPPAPGFVLDHGRERSLSRRSQRRSRTHLGGQGTVENYALASLGPDSRHFQRRERSLSRRSQRRSRTHLGGQGIVENRALASLGTDSRHFQRRERSLSRRSQRRSRTHLGGPWTVENYALASLTRRLNARDARVPERKPADRRGQQSLPPDDPSPPGRPDQLSTTTALRIE